MKRMECSGILQDLYCVLVYMELYFIALNGVPTVHQLISEQRCVFPYMPYGLNDY